MATSSVPPAAGTSLPIRRFLNRNFRVLLAFLVFLVLAALNAILNPRFFEPSVTTSTSNQAMTLIFAGTAQTSVVITGGIDLSVGPIISLANSLASSMFTDSIPGVIAVVILVLLVGALCGLVNGLIVVYGRLQPIIVTLATSSVFGGIALFLRPKPGGFVPGWYGDLLTARLFDVIPNSLIFLLIVLILVCDWRLVFVCIHSIRKREYGRSLHAAIYRSCRAGRHIAFRRLRRRDRDDLRSVLAEADQRRPVLCQGKSVATTSLGGRRDPAGSRRGRKPDIYRQEPPGHHALAWHR